MSLYIAIIIIIIIELNVHLKIISYVLSIRCYGREIRTRRVLNVVFCQPHIKYNNNNNITKLITCKRKSVSKMYMVINP